MNSTEDSPTGSLKVLLVGVSHYSNPKWNIPNVAVNIKKLEKAFLDSSILGVPRANLTVLSNDRFTREDFLITLENFIATVSKDDIFIVYYSGHGVFDYSKVQNKYTTFLTTPKSIDRPTISGVSIEEFREFIKDSPAKRKIIILDCCYSGRIHDGKMDLTAAGSLNHEVTIKFSKVEGTFTMSATSEDQTAGYSPTEPHRPTYFTSALLDVFHEGIENGEPFCSINEIYQEVENRLVNGQKSKPEASSYKRGFEIQILKNKKFVPKRVEASVILPAVEGTSINPDGDSFQKLQSGNEGQGMRVRKLFRGQIGITSLLILLCLLSVPFARMSYYSSGDDSMVFTIATMLSLILFIVSVTISFITLKYPKMWLLTALALLTIIFQFRLPELSVKYGWISDKGENTPDVPELTGSIERARSRYGDGNWRSALEIFSLLKARMPKGDPAIGEMKILLSRAGYYKGEINDGYSDEILTALNNLKTHYGLEADGIVEDTKPGIQVSLNTQTVLYALAYGELLGLKVPAKPTLLEINTAVKNFQRLNGLHPDGDIGGVTIAKLKSGFDLNTGKAIVDQGK
jgi:peptidoglycan hydrolase-like protein with peptidoglycan-binding domain